MVLTLDLQYSSSPINQHALGSQAVLSGIHDSAEKAGTLGHHALAQQAGGQTGSHWEGT